MDKNIITEQEFEQMVERLRPRLMQMGREFFGSDTEAEEVVQETWLRAWNVRDRVELTDAYILRIARNCCVSMWRGQRTQVELVDEESAAVTEVTQHFREHRSQYHLQRAETLAQGDTSSFYRPATFALIYCSCIGNCHRRRSCRQSEWRCARSHRACIGNTRGHYYI